MYGCIGAQLHKRGAYPMGTVVRFPARRHARASSDDGNRSGRSAERETPVSRSIGRTNSAGTPCLDLVSQYQTCPCVVPIALARRLWPPIRSQANLSASVRIMESGYPFLSSFQPKTLSATLNRGFGSLLFMADESAQGIGNRIKKRRKALGLSQPKLAKILDVPQQTIGGWETGRARRPTKLFELSKVLCTTQEWLLREEGPEIVEPPDPKAAIKQALEALDPMLVPAAMEFLRKLGEKDAAA
jgi:transcriptional regulator with XRE-family HTH domain